MLQTAADSFTFWRLRTSISLSCFLKADSSSSCKNKKEPRQQEINHAAEPSASTLNNECKEGTATILPRTRPTALKTYRLVIAGSFSSLVVLMQPESVRFVLGVAGCDDMPCSMYAPSASLSAGIDPLAWTFLTVAPDRHPCAAPASAVPPLFAWKPPPAPGEAAPLVTGVPVVARRKIKKKGMELEASAKAATAGIDNRRQLFQGRATRVSMHQNRHEGKQSISRALEGIAPQIQKA